MEREKRDIFGKFYTGYLLSIVNIKRERETEREREQQIIHKIEIDREV